MKTFLGLVLALCFLHGAFAQTCASDEYDNNGTCACNTTIYPFNASQTPSPVVECLAGKMRLNISKCLLEASGLNSSSLQLRNSTCAGTQAIYNNISTVVVTTDTKNGSCGTTLTINGTQVVFDNVLNALAGRLNGIIVRSNTSWNFSCSYNLTMQTALLTVLKPVLGSTSLQIPGGLATVVVTMAIYTDSSFTVPLQESQKVFNLQDNVYVGMMIPDLDASKFSVHVTSMYATGVNNSNTVPKYYIISNGCPAPDMSSFVQIIKNGNTSEARFVVKVFMIAGSDSVYLFAEVQICEGTCIDNCSGTRTVRAAGNTATLSTGPIEADSTDSSSGTSNCFSWSAQMSSLLLVLLVLRWM